MKHRNNYPLFFFVLMLSMVMGSHAQPTVSFTFDDGMLADFPEYSFEEWNNLLLQKLKEADIKAMLFIAGRRKDTKRGTQLLSSWNNNGHFLANHTWKHHNYNNSAITFDIFAKDMLRGDSLLRTYSNFRKFFRFPYLKEGNTPQKIDAFRAFLKGNDYKNGYVTIDASDWYIDNRLVDRLKSNKTTDLDAYRDYYLQHIWERAQFYENLSYELNGRHIKHTLLLHHNLLAALFIDDLIKMFQEKGWKIVSAEEAFTDPIFGYTPRYAGESLIYAMAKDSGDFKNLLRYPAEDGRYEKEAMDRLGL
ncbi:polysaccharide deacetylase family protein [Flavobacteriaceae bacterium TP-CH-4]|uniref:Polysaccharide deacetylase family protein n=1 Tax=Pelagihabitans pacificus TaxID=2696054 RepID=A0A967AQW1_9FLAO|nr:polysaccharide deacetylase family protein [Pelagihabitans pacificus]NHF58731.1 polysaccharide deacetylase family protein [Pelagihabitans pacificus]